MQSERRVNTRRSGVVNRSRRDKTRWDRSSAWSCGHSFVSGSANIQSNGRGAPIVSTCGLRENVRRIERARLAPKSRLTLRPTFSRLLKKSLSYGFEHSVVAEVERDLNLEGAVVTEFG